MIIYVFVFKHNKLVFVEIRWRTVFLKLFFDEFFIGIVFSILNNSVSGRRTMNLTESCYPSKIFWLFVGCHPSMTQRHDEFGCSWGATLP